MISGNSNNRAARHKPAIEVEPQEPNWRVLRVKVFLSICLFAFMIGMMFGRVTNKPTEPSRLLSLQPTASAGGLELCFNQRVKVQQHLLAGAVILSFQNVAPTEAKQGKIQLADQGQGSWLLDWQDNELRLGITAVVQQQVNWQWRDDSSCLALRLSAP